MEERVSTDRGTMKSKEMGGHSEMGEKRERDGKSHPNAHHGPGRRLQPSLQTHSDHHKL